MSQTICYIDGKQYLRGTTSSTSVETRIMGSYFGSGTRLGEVGEVFSPGSQIPYPEHHIRIVEVGTDGIENIVYEGIPDIKSFCISLFETENETSLPVKFSEQEIAKLKDDKLKKIEKIKEGTYCPLSIFHMMKVGERNVSLMFRDLHRWGGKVEISGFSYLS